MPDQRFPATLILSTLALIFSGAGMLQNTTTLLVTALIITQALSLIAALNHPHISTGIYSAAIIFLTIIAFAYLIGLWIRHTHQQHLNIQRTQRTRQTQLTSLLHDTIAADLTSVIVQLEKLAITTPERNAELKNAAHTARGALDKTRQLLTTLNTQSNIHPAPSFLTTLKTMTQRLRDHGFTVTTTTNLTTPITMTLHSTALERMLSETVTNIIKHATPQSLVTVSVISDTQGVTLTITNAHSLTNRTSASTHLGLTSMSNTLHAVGGELKTHSNDKEWVTIAHIPFCGN
ncbi:two-component system sensor histidine kinase [Corynebacterium diphtheriae]|nr:two-component system sensor histidine kinase [Corynebacterium diphtheriae]